MTSTISYAAQAAISVLSLFGGFAKKVAPPERLVVHWTGLASLIALFGFLSVKLLSMGGWSYTTYKFLVRLDFVLFAICTVVCFAYVLALRTKTVEHKGTVDIIGTELTTDAQDHVKKYGNSEPNELMKAFGDVRKIWTSDSIRKARFSLALEYAFFIASLAFSLNLAIELQNSPVKAPTPIALTLGEESSRLQDVHFSLNKSDLSGDATEKLSDDAMILGSVFKRFPNARLIIEGHCDDQGEANRNLALGYERAQIVQTALIADGIGASKISVASHGSGSPVCAGFDEACRQKNRRAHLRVVE